MKTIHKNDDENLQIELLKKDIRTMNDKIFFLSRSINGWKNITVIVLILSLFLTIFNYSLVKVYINNF